MILLILIFTMPLGSLYSDDATEDGRYGGGDGSGSGIPGRAGDVSLFFVLGKQPFGQFPPGK